VILPVIQLRRLFGYPPAEINRATRLVAVHVDDTMMALQVDAVIDLLDCDQDQLAPLPAGVDPLRARLLRGTLQLADRPIGIIDLSALLAVIQEAQS
jgi:purine-binding chemotaxis protein CheW